MKNFNVVEAVTKDFFNRDDINNILSENRAQRNRRIEISDLLPMNVSEELFEIFAQNEHDSFGCGFRAGITFFLEVMKK